MFQINFGEQEKQILLAGLDMLTRELGAQINKAGGNAARDGAMKLIAVDNTARLISEAPPAPPTIPEAQGELKELPEL